MKRNLDFLFPGLVALLGLIVSFILLPYGVDSLYDEGYLWLCIQKAMDGRVRGGSLWSNMIFSIFGKEICGSILSLRIVNAILSIVSAVTFWLITWPKIAKGGLRSVAYLVTILLILSPLGGIIVCYNGISRLLLLLACAASFRIFVDGDKANALWAVLAGFSLMLAFFSILPSSVMVGGAVSVMLLIKYWKEWRKLLKYFGMMLLGAVAALLVIHFFIANLATVFESMTRTANSITKLNRGYDPASFCVKIVLFFRDYSLCMLTSIGIVVVSVFLKRYGYSWLASLFYIAAFLMYWHYQEKPMLTLGIQMLLLWLQPVIIMCYDKKTLSLKQLLSFDFFINLFLCFFPILAIIGTNLSLGMKLEWFIIPWALLMWRLGGGNGNCAFRKEMLFVCSIVVLMGYVQQIKMINTSKTVVDKGPLVGMRLDPLQESHFKKVDGLLSEYQYKRGQSVVFSTQLSIMTLCYFESVPVGLYFQPMDFLAHADETLPVPDYLFLCEYDTVVAGEKLKEMPWGWPEEFDVFEVGAPDDPKRTDYPINRSLYCRRSLRRNMIIKE